MRGAEALFVPLLRTQGEGRLAVGEQGEGKITTPKCITGSTKKEAIGGRVYLNSGKALLKELLRENHRGQLSPAADIHFFKDRLQMILYRIWRNMESRRNLSG